MEVSNRDPKNGVNGILNGENEDDDGDDDEAQALLPKDCGKAKKVEKSKRKVQWNDRNGDKLAEVLEFEPSDVSDSDDEESESCFCRIM